MCGGKKGTGKREQGKVRARWVEDVCAKRSHRLRKRKAGKGKEPKGRSTKYEGRKRMECGVRNSDCGLNNQSRERQ